ncbi:MAG: hypothetical protein AAGN46_08480 [Acidobacteriota bacterium]
MFLERLQAVSDRIDGARLLSLVAADGIKVEAVGGDDLELDIDVLAAELLSQVRSVSQNHEELAVGSVRSYSVSTDRWTLMIHALTDDYFLLLVLDPDVAPGRARFELRRSTLLFESDLV